MGIDLHWSRCLGPVLKKSQRIRFAPNGRQRNSICLPTSEMAMQSRHRHPCRKCLHHLHHHVQIIQLRTLRTSSIGCVPTLGTRIGWQFWPPPIHIFAQQPQKEIYLTLNETQTTICLCADNPRKSRGHAWNSHQTLQRHWHYILCKNTCSLEPGVRHSLMQESKTLLWFGSSQVVLSVAGESAQQFVGATALPSVSQRPPRSWVCSMLKAIGDWGENLRHNSIASCFNMFHLDRSFGILFFLERVFRRRCLKYWFRKQSSGQEAGRRQDLSLHCLQLLRSVRKRRFNSAAADASWFDLARGLQLRANCTAKGSIVSRGLVNPILVLVFVFNKLPLWQYCTIPISAAYKHKSDAMHSSIMPTLEWQRNLSPRLPLKASPYRSPHPQQNFMTLHEIAPWCMQIQNTQQLFFAASASTGSHPEKNIVSHETHVHSQW